MNAHFNRFSINITKSQAAQGSHSGQCDTDISELLQIPSIRRQLDKIPADDIAAELSEYGAWNDAELKDKKTNRARILWIACGDVNENKY